MPQGSGVEAIQKLKADHPDVKIIAITGVDPQIRNELLARAKQGGADRVFPKPTDMQSLRDAIKELLEEAS
jgi:CheY-like chemotaxis protein